MQLAKGHIGRLTIRGSYSGPLELESAANAIYMAIGHLPVEQDNEVRLDMGKAHRVGKMQFLVFVIDPSGATHYKHAEAFRRQHAENIFRRLREAFPGETLTMLVEWRSLSLDDGSFTTAESEQEFTTNTKET
jgi:hypothetical protein